MTDPFGFTKITAPVFRDACNIEETEMKILALTITSNIAEAIDDEYITDYINKYKNTNIECINESLLKTLFHVTDNIKSYRIFDKYINYFSDNITIRLFPTNELITMLPRLMIYMQIIIHNLKNIKENEKNKDDFIYGILFDFDKYKKWTKDFGCILEYICNTYVDEVIEKYNKEINKEKNNE